MKIRNKQTGQVLDVPDEKLGDYGIQSSQTSSGITPEMAAAAQIFLPSSDATRIKNAYDIQIQAQDAAQKQKDAEDKLSGAKELKTQALQVAQDLKNRDYGKITGAKGLGVILGISGSPGMATQSKYDQLKGLLSLENVKYLKGQGQVSDAERRLLEDAASALKTNLSNKDFGIELDKILESLGGDPAASVTNNPTPDLVKNKNRGLLANILAGSSLDFVNDSARTIELNSPEGKQMTATTENKRKMAEDAIKQISSTTDPKKRQILTDYANKLLNESSSESQSTVDSFSNSINTPTWLRGLGVGQEVATAAEAVTALPKLLSSVLKAGGKTVSSVPGKVFTQGAGKAVRNEAIDTAEGAGKVINGDDVMKSIDEWSNSVRTANPAAAGKIDKIVQGAKGMLEGKSITPSEAMDIWNEANNGFKASGVAGKAVEQSFHRVLRDALRGVLENVAPGFEKGTKMIAQGIGRSAIANKVANIAGTGAVSGLTFALLNKILNAGKSTVSTQ